jgi:regulator of replication initiation timing
MSKELIEALEEEIERLVDETVRLSQIIADLVGENVLLEDDVKLWRGISEGLFKAACGIERPMPAIREYQRVVAEKDYPAPHAPHALDDFVAMRGAINESIEESMMRKLEDDH